MKNKKTHQTPLSQRNESARVKRVLVTWVKCESSGKHPHSHSRDFRQRAQDLAHWTAVRAH